MKVDIAERRAGRVSARAARSGAVLAACLVLSACGLTAPSRSAGYADLGTLGARDVDRTFALSIGPSLLRLAARHLDDEPELRALMNSLRGVRVRIYEIDGDAARVAARLDRMAGRLDADGWEEVLLARDGSERTRMLMRRRSTGRIRGLAVLSSDGEGEVVLVNLMGDIRPEQFGEVMVALDVEAPAVRLAGVAN